MKYWYILYIDLYSLVLRRSTCSCQHGPSLHSGIRQSLHPYVVLGDFWGLLNSLLLRDLFVVFAESSHRGFLFESFLMRLFLPASKHAEQVFCPLLILTALYPWYTTGYHCISSTETQARLLRGSGAEISNRELTSCSRNFLWPPRFGQPLVE